MHDILEILSDLRPDIEFSESTDLVDILDSFDFVSLIGSLNDAFDIQVDVIDLVPENFGSPIQMLFFVEKLVNQ